VATVGNLFVVEEGEAPRRVPTAFDKKPVAASVRVTRLGLLGDEQADLAANGGIDKAVYAYPFEHYAFWSVQRLAALKRDVPLSPGAMGENVTISGLLEDEVWVGDQLHIGDTVFQVTEPRVPCFKFNVRMGFGHASKAMMRSGATGFFLRVLKEGNICAGDAITLIAGPRKQTIQAINEQRLNGPQQDLF
jgi:MOSC domain-containing protein YiiM